MGGLQTLCAEAEMNARLTLDTGQLRVDSFEVAPAAEAAVKPYQVEITTFPCITKGPNFC